MLDTMLGLDAVLKAAVLEAVEKFLAATLARLEATGRALARAMTGRAAEAIAKARYLPQGILEWQIRQPTKRRLSGRTAMQYGVRKSHSANQETTKHD